MQLRDYQEKAIGRVDGYWAQGHRRVCLVAPTGSGKTLMGSTIARRQRTLWLVHRDELIGQTRKALGQTAIGVGPDVQVDTVQRLLASGDRPEADVIVLDECHHYAADEWGAVAKHYGSIPVLGLTATPERADGRPLGDMFDVMVVAANYSELVKAGHLVPCKVIRAPRVMDSGELAHDPIKAYRAHADGTIGFMYLNRVATAHEWADKFSEAGIRSAAIDGKMPKGDRRVILSRFVMERIKLLTNVYVLTEGVDVPAATVCILARKVGHPSSYLQMVGRVLRPAPGKTEAVLLDLCGVSHEHGLPTQDRIYSLRGSAIRVQGAPVKDCPECGAVLRRLVMECPECGYQFPDPVFEPEPKSELVIYDLALQSVYAGVDTPVDAKSREWSRLEGLAGRRGWSIGFALKEYRKLFPGENPPQGIAENVQRAEYQRLLAVVRDKGYRLGWASHRFKASFGRWPPRAWQPPG